MSGNNQWNGGNDQWGADGGAPNQQAPQQALQQVPDQPKKRSRAIPILWTILALVVIAAVVVIAVQVINNRASNNTSADGGAASSEATTSPAEESPKYSSTEEADDSDTESGPSVSERCTISYMHKTGVVPAELDDVERCDGTWAGAFQHGSDWLIPLHWTGSEWEEYYPDEENIYSPIGGPCYSAEKCSAMVFPKIRNACLAGVRLHRKRKSTRTITTATELSPRCRLMEAPAPFAMSRVTVIMS